MECWACTNETPEGQIFCDECADLAERRAEERLERLTADDLRASVENQ